MLTHDQLKEQALKRPDVKAAYDALEFAFLKKRLLRHKARLFREYKLKELGVFGSYVRQEQTDASDVDILVDFVETPDLFTFVGLKNALSDLLGLPVDLVMKSALKPAIGQRILKEVVLI